jgi:exoribonuclease-2
MNKMLDDFVENAPERARRWLETLAREAMRERGLDPDHPPEALAELARLQAAAPAAGDGVQDLRALPWCSIDNDDSLDLDQLTCAEPLPGGRTRARVAVADVDALVRPGGAIDGHARHNTTSVYVPGTVFHMLPEGLSTGLTSLNLGADRYALVMAFDVGTEGEVSGGEVCRGVVRNHAKLAYRGVGEWLEGEGPLPEAAAAVPGLEANLRLQDQAARALKARRHERGALDFQSVEAKPVFDADALKDLRVERKNRARDLIEDFMIAANGVTARFLEDHRVPSLRRVVRSPKRWDRIVQVAADLGEALPAAPDAGALSAFLARRRAADPLRFPELSLTVVKLMGGGEYAVEAPGRDAGGHFGLAERDYAHSTAPNRRFPDLVTQRLVKAVLAGARPPYSEDDLGALAVHCTKKEDDAAKVERRMRKSAAALLLAPRVGQRFDALVTGASEKGTWVRLLDPPVEGKVVRGAGGLDVGERVRVQLLSTEVRQGHIDFQAVR